MPYLNKFKIRVLLLFGLIYPLYANTCDLEFDGSEFLEASYSKGISPGSTCYEINISKNLFFAFPDKPCELTFARSGWLNDGWDFKGIQGSGTFSTKISDTDFIVIIDATGGFRLNSIMLHSDADNCENTTLETVL
ncbi:hypothetical protein Ping_2979 [Psychromonas ingrahamii 37]|uniref:Uncharacterized protein n=1 Tax=Psychromonas ingrahamii (strain DSM 17664 / CCUG 51855 / 37) TaxID=357804 RepID=A1SYW6_PSYIN|nr:hypothetical protein [Psychromonas ingrahamii]ABM04681.1 hypothetical protein Ping_2979 [Psychromonas ingrahamii 37]